VQEQVAETSHADTDIAQAVGQLLETGRSRKVIQRISKQKKPRRTTKKHICWQGPGLWPHVLAAVKAEGFEHAKRHPTDVIRRLQNTHRDTGLFEKLHQSVLGRWFSTDSEGRACWKPTVLLRALKESGQGGLGRSRKLVSEVLRTL
jgi:hypothetical protein